MEQISYRNRGKKTNTLITNRKNEDFKISSWYMKQLSVEVLPNNTQITYTQTSLEE